MCDYVSGCCMMFFGVDKVTIESKISKYIDKDTKVNIEEEDLVVKVKIEKSSANGVEVYSIIKELSNEFQNEKFADIETTLQESVVNLLTEKCLLMGCSESLTGGLICSKICEIPGASNVLFEGIVAYTNEAKVRRLHVNASTIEKDGAVSLNVAKQMLNGLLSNRNIKYGIATTGVAGPASDEFDNPIGTAYVAYGEKYNIKVEKVQFEGSRNQIRERVSNYALFKLLKFMSEDNSF